jgi:hypothetical protein
LIACTSPLAIASRHHVGRLGLGLGLALARLGVAEGGFAPALGLQDLRLLLALGLAGSRLPLAFGLEDLRRACRARPSSAGPSIRRGRAAASMSLISMRVILTPHGAGRGVDDLQQPLVDLVALRQQLVEVHRAHDRADVGHGELRMAFSRLVTS